MTSVLYLLLSKPVFQPTFLRATEDSRIQRFKTLGLTFLVGICGTAVAGLQVGGPYTYLSLIVAWATPVLIFLW
jgi:15-cis-phytoene synthase/lycopene beta-cyclase